MKDYLDIVYAKNSTNPSNYPEQLVDYIIRQGNLRSNADLKLLEPGVGCGDHLRIFAQKGFVVRGLDISERSVKISPDLDIDLVNSDEGFWPYDDCSFDVIYSKSFIEHLREPQLFLREAYRVLKPGGIIVTLTPDWAANYKKFYDDYTHVSPFTAISLRNIKLSVGFICVESFAFRQLPITWDNPFLNSLCGLIAHFVPYRTNLKFFRWCRELMLISYGTKPSE